MFFYFSLNAVCLLLGVNSAYPSSPSSLVGFGIIKCFMTFLLLTGNPYVPCNPYPVVAMCDKFSFKCFNKPYLVIASLYVII